MRPKLLLLVLAGSLPTALSGCGGGSEPGPAREAPAGTAAQAASAAPAPGVSGNEPDEPGAEAEGIGEAPEPAPGTTGAPAAATTTTTTAGPPAEPIPPEQQIASLLEEVGGKKTKDDRALAALEEAKALGAPPRDLAKAANKRGERLFGEPERAAALFEWARAADEKFPDATFNLAKLAANTGEVERVKELLTEVKKRGGKKLLKTVEFDPTFALVADDPDVQALLR